ncbi:MAG TPA: BON domain-containing protein [Casimicrobiaceae bacterium]|nr:BON domain-containing protein [Casimicrobiaceae bacterium]
MRHKTSMLLLTTMAAASLAVAACDRPSDSPTAQRLNAEAAKLADKGAQVANQVATATDDTMITAKVKAAILAEPGLRSSDINVDTKDATVTLSGTVASLDLREKAKQLASTTEGVKSVVDNLSVKSTATS